METEGRRQFSTRKERWKVEVALGEAFGKDLLEMRGCVSGGWEDSGTSFL